MDSLTDRLSAKRTLSASFWCFGKDQYHAVTADYAGVFWLQQSPGVYGAFIRRSAAVRYLCQGEGSTVAKVIGGELFNYEYTGIAGMANTGTDRNWTGHSFGQANWFVFGRMAWDPTLSAEATADEWIRMTFTNNEDFIKPLKEMMKSREAGVNYRNTLGLTHLYAQDHHYGPAPWTENLSRADWTSPHCPKGMSEARSV